METTELLSIAAREGLRLARDALSPGSLPYRAEQVCRPDTLARLINDWALDPQHQPVRISAVRRQDIPSVSSNCHNLVLSLEQDGAALFPDTVFVKLPMESLLTRWFFSIIGSWRLESHFFRHVAAGVPLRTPTTYAAHWQGSRFFLVQENLHADPSVELFTNHDMLAGPSVELAYRCLDAFARLHAAHAGLHREARARILPLDYHPMLSPTMGTVSRALNSLALETCMKKLVGVIPADVAAAYRLTLQHWDELRDYWFSEHLSLLHGDSHLGNFFVSGEDMGMLDWQAAHWGKGVRDVQYFLTNSLPVDTLAARETELVDYYVSRRRHYGAPLDPEHTWQEYRSFTYHTLMTIVVSIGFGALNKEQDALMAEVLRRAVAAVQRLDYAGWLDRFIVSRGSAGQGGTNRAR
jgi:hypothetical protein